MARHILAVCLDCGDTLVDEATEVKTPEGVSLRANLIPGAAELMSGLKERGYPLALVADGPCATFENNLGPYKLYDVFDVYAISETLEVVKPHPRMFLHALEALNIPPEHYGCVVMLGNHLERDIKGANDAGLISVWLNWSPRRSKVPANPSEQPQFTINSPLELLALLDQFEQDHITASISNKD